MHRSNLVRTLELVAGKGWDDISMLTKYAKVNHSEGGDSFMFHENLCGQI